MKKILITGANSYIGTSFENYIKKYDNYTVETIDMTKESWREKDFSNYDVVFHVAGIAHVDVGHASEEIKKMYYKVNTELTIETATKAKKEGVSQFIFMSSAIVYGESAPMGKIKMITKNTIPHPSNFYGDSKLQAEKGIADLRDDNFKVVILRPPMIYGKNSKGNYPLLAKIAKKLPVFPDIKNQRSMLYIENLLEFIKIMIDKEKSGLFFPQNREYVSTTEMVRLIASTYNKKIYVTKILNPFVWLACKMPGKIGGMANKAFGNFAYELEMSGYGEKDYRVYKLEETVIRTEIENG